MGATRFRELSRGSLSSTICIRITSYRTDPALCEQLVKSSYGAAKWLADKGVRFIPRLTHAYKEGDIFKMSPGLSSEAVGGGAGLVEREVQLALKTACRFATARGRCR